MIRIAVVGLGKMGLSHLAMLRAPPRGRVGRRGRLDPHGRRAVEVRRAPHVHRHESPLQEVEGSRSSSRRRPGSTCRWFASVGERPARLLRETAVPDPGGLGSLAELAASRVSSHRSATTTASSEPSARCGTCSTWAPSAGSPTPWPGVRPGRAEAQGRHLAQPALRRRRLPVRLRRPSGRPAVVVPGCAQLGRRNRARPGLLGRDRGRVYSTLHYPDGSSAQLSVNWSDESYRKMTTA